MLGGQRGQDPPPATPAAAWAIGCAQASQGLFLGGQKSHGAYVWVLVRFCEGFAGACVLEHSLAGWVSPGTTLVLGLEVPDLGCFSCFWGKLVHWQGTVLAEHCDVPGVPRFLGTSQSPG